MNCAANVCPIVRALSALTSLHDVRPLMMLGLHNNFDIFLISQNNNILC